MTRRDKILWAVGALVVVLVAARAALPSPSRTWSTRLMALETTTATSWTWILHSGAAPIAWKVSDRQDRQRSSRCPSSTATD